MTKEQWHSIVSAIGAIISAIGAFFVSSCTIQSLIN